MPLEPVFAGSLRAPAFLSDRRGLPAQTDASARRLPACRAFPRWGLARDGQASCAHLDMDRRTAEGHRLTDHDSRTRMQHALAPRHIAATRQELSASDARVRPRRATVAA
jgi:hypothetical protein